MTRPVVAFISDFGTRDQYVAVMKGVVLSTVPDAHLVDVKRGAVVEVRPAR